MPTSDAELPRSDHGFTLAYALLRITLGINIALHGISRTLAGPGTFVASLTKQFAATPLPELCSPGFRVHPALARGLDRSPHPVRSVYPSRPGRRSAAHRGSHIWQLLASGLECCRPATDLRGCIFHFDCLPAVQLTFFGSASSARFIHRKLMRPMHASQPLLFVEYLF